LSALNVADFEKGRGRGDGGGAWGEAFMREAGLEIAEEEVVEEEGVEETGSGGGEDMGKMVEDAETLLLRAVECLERGEEGLKGREVVLEEESDVERRLLLVCCSAL